MCVLPRGATKMETKLCIAVSTTTPTTTTTTTTTTPTTTTTVPTTTTTTTAPTTTTTSTTTAPTMDASTAKAKCDAVKEPDGSLRDNFKMERLQNWDGEGLKLTRAPCQKSANGAPESTTTEADTNPLEPRSGKLD